MRKALSVKQFNEYFKSNIKHDPIFQNLYINGQLSNVRINNSHLYFSLKEDRDIIDCVIYYYDDKDIDFSVEVGKDVLVKGTVIFNNYSSRIVISVNEIKEKGLSQKYLEFLQMKEEFKKKGYFDPERKKEIPKFPQKIGLITSEEGAAIVDFLSVINQKPNDMHIYLSPVKVQGESSPLMVKRAIESLDKRNLDLIVITRGGGSSEDLSSFNDRLVIDATFVAKTPIISAIGHKIDKTLLDLVADLSLQTPTEAGSYVIKNYSDISREMKNIIKKMGEITQSRIRDYEFKLLQVRKNLERKSPIREIDKRINSLTYLKKDLDLKLKSNLSYNEQKFRLISSELKRFEDIIEIGKKNIHIKDDLGNAVFSKHSLKKSDIAFIEFSDGKVKVEVVD
ncbi:MAG: exodeoxyribonuclease VII large subunit [Anaerococcus sp.]|uniref:exodeoxyribonuclease VII large subunit n=1 Tax=Anaerococcus sp. TaxID=1872515 RepID=UPI002605EE7C|nr:exodeoxyribonuclease VII large subunit [Anaerococcus sp.]MCI5972683.1 exodeoxyribonuclease VII large subunit [Anaerococcus sp.]MDD6918728.1 exodeoxyribonuclease VII large subunit [Peptoniphilaceae bacterium]MDY2928227.1 exodeoxyribonuclease VII large subunit [Anaerococcus sp.]